MGDSGVGKTSILVQFDQGKFQSGSFSATVGIGFTVSRLFIYSQLIICFFSSSSLMKQISVYTVYSIWQIFIFSPLQIFDLLIWIIIYNYIYIIKAVFYFFFGLLLIIIDSFENFFRFFETQQENNSIDLIIKYIYKNTKQIY